MFTAGATTTAIIALFDPMLTTIGGQALVLIVAMISAIFIYVLGRKALYWVWRKISKL